MESTFSQDAFSNYSNESCNELSLFVGCLDPQTTKEDIQEYFRNFDPNVKAKLIVNFKTGQSKQCALLFCSSPAACDFILQQEHHLHHRRLRVDRAQQQFKGKKSESASAIQVSGLDPAITIDQVNQFFTNFDRFSRARLIQGLHPKQKKVAVVYFSKDETVQELLKFSHLQIGNRNCKVAEYTKEMTSCPRPKPMNPNAYEGHPGFNQGLHSHSNWGFSAQGAQNQWNLPSFDFHQGGYSMANGGYQNTGMPTLSRSKPLQLLNLESKKNLPKVDHEPYQPKTGAEPSFLHAVEVEDDDLFRVFYGKKEKPVQRDKLGAISKDQSFRKVVDSKETAPEEE